MQTINHTPALSSTTADRFLEPLSRFIIREFLHGDASLTPETPLLEWGVIDSMTIIDVIVFISEQLGVRVPDEEIRPDNFATVRALSRMLAALDDAARVRGAA